MPIVNPCCPKKETYLLVDPPVDPTEKVSFADAKAQICSDLEDAIACAFSEGVSYAHLVEQYGALCNCAVADSGGGTDPTDPDDATVPCLTCPE